MTVFDMYLLGMLVSVVFLAIFGYNYVKDSGGNYFN